MKNKLTLFVIFIAIFLSGCISHKKIYSAREYKPCLYGSGTLSE